MSKHSLTGLLYKSNGNSEEKKKFIWWREDKKGAKQQKFIKAVTHQVKFGQQNPRQVSNLNFCIFFIWM